MEKKSIYLIVRLDIRTDMELTQEVLNDMVADMDWGFESGTDGLFIESYDICDNTDKPTF